MLLKKVPRSLNISEPFQEWSRKEERFQLNKKPGFSTDSQRTGSQRIYSCKKETDAPHSKSLIHFIRKTTLQDCDVNSDSLKLADKGSIIVRELHTRRCKQELMCHSFLSIKLREQGTIVKHVYIKHVFY